MDESHEITSEICLPARGKLLFSDALKTIDESREKPE